jgi:phosphopantetheinyl transferase
LPERPALRVDLWRFALSELVAWQARTPEARRLAVAEHACGARPGTDDAASRHLAGSLATQLVLADCARPTGTMPATSRSYSGDHVHVAVAFADRLGVDAEIVRPLPRGAGALHRLLSAQERARLETLPEAQRGPEVFRLWTLKEAYLKARGVGLSGEPWRLTFRREADGWRVDPADTHGWVFATFADDRATISGAVAARTADPGPIGIDVWMHQGDPAAIWHTIVA